MTCYLLAFETKKEHLFFNYTLLQCYYGGRYNIQPYVRKYSIVGRQKERKLILFYTNEQAAKLLLKDTVC